MREPLIEHEGRVVCGEASAQEAELRRGLACLLADRESQVNRLIIGDGIQRFARLFARLAAQQQQCGPLRRLQVGVESGYRFGGLVSSNRGVAEGLQRRIRHHRIRVFTPETLEFGERLGAVA